MINESSVEVFDVDEERRRRFLVIRPIGHLVGAAVVVPLTWLWDEPRLLWLSIGMVLVAATSVLGRGGRPTRLALVLISDVMWTGIVIASLGVNPLAAALLFAGHASTAYLTLPLRWTRWTVTTIVVVLGALVVLPFEPPPSMTDGRILLTESIMACFGLASIIGDFELIGRAMREVARRRRRDLEAAEHVAEQRASALRSVSHELRTPLTSITGFAHVLTEPFVTPEDRVEFAERIVTESDHLDHLVGDLLAAARLDAGRLHLDIRPVTVLESVSRVADVFEPRGMQVDIDVDPSHIVVADESRLAQILRNLLSNAEKYGGSETRMHSRREGGHIVLSVVDDGPGVQSSDREHIFQDFAQGGIASQSTGTGLGLGISRRLAVAMGGDLSCVDAPIGACFELALPAHG